MEEILFPNKDLNMVLTDFGKYFIKCFVQITKFHIDLTSRNWQIDPFKNKNLYPFSMRKQILKVEKWD